MNSITHDGSTVTIEISKGDAERFLLDMTSSESVRAKIEEQIRSQLLDTDVRQRALWGEYEPEYKSVFYIRKDGSESSDIADDFATHAKNYWERGYIFFPFPELRAEYKTIAEGNWLPKEWDEYVAVNRTTKKIMHRGKAMADYSLASDVAYFPSDKQAQEWIDRQTPEVPDNGYAKMENGERYYCVYANGEVSGFPWFNDSIDKYQLLCGNVFRTEVAAKKKQKQDANTARVLSAYHRHVDRFGDKREWDKSCGFLLNTWVDKRAFADGSWFASGNYIPFPDTTAGIAARDAFAAEVGLEAIADFIRDNP